MLVLTACGDPQADATLMSDADLADPTVDGSPAAVLVQHVNLVLAEELSGIMNQYDPEGVLLLSPSGANVAEIWTLKQVQVDLSTTFAECDFTQIPAYQVLTQNVRVASFAMPAGYADPTDILVEADGPDSMGYCPSYDGEGNYQYHLDDPAWSYVMRFIEPDGYRIRATFDGFSL